MATSALTPEMRWTQWLRSSDDPAAGLRDFCPHYFYFSYRQVVAFSGLFTKVDPFDRESLAMLADVLCEELGKGDPERVHSRLFERFAHAVDLSPEDLRIAPRDVLPGVRDYVEELERVFADGTLAQALAAYVFLESSAVETYGPLVTVLLERGFREEDVEFFALHAQVEVEHAAAADAMLQRYGLSQESPEVREQTARMASLWHTFWDEIDNACR